MILRADTMSRFRFVSFLVAASLVFNQEIAWAQKIDVVSVVSKATTRSVDLPGEFQPFLITSLHARVSGYVERVLVDRGSNVKQGQLLVELSCLLYTSPSPRD